MGSLGHCRHADPIVADRECPCRSIGVIADLDRAGGVIGKGMLERVNDQLGDNEPQADRNIRARDALVDANVERELIVVADHRRADAAAQIGEVGAQLDITQRGCGEMLLERRHGHNSVMGVMKVETSFIRLDPARTQQEHAGDNLEAVGDPVLKLLQQDAVSRTRSSLLFSATRASVTSAIDRSKRTPVRIAVVELVGVKHEPAEALALPLLVHLTAVNLGSNDSLAAMTVQSLSRSSSCAVDDAMTASARLVAASG
jgi:hypothetical protein